MSHPPQTPVRNDGVTIPCPVCGTPFTPLGRARFCSPACRQAAWRTRHHAPTMPVVERSHVIYQCPECETRYLGEQRCDTCNRWCARVGPGGECPHCQEPVAITDLISATQLAAPDRTQKRKSTTKPKHRQNRSGGAR